MRTRTKRFPTVVAAALAVLALTGPAVAGSSALTLQGSNANGSVVCVVVKNTSLLPRIGMVNVQAMVNGMQVFGTAGVLLLPGQTATVNVAFTGTVSNVASVSLSDDTTPY